LHKHFIRYRRVTYEPDPDSSWLEAFVEIGAPDLSLYVHVRGREHKNWRHEAPQLRAPTACPGVMGWRDLTGVSARTEFEVDELFLRRGRNLFIMPDIPASLYDWKHYALNHHRFRFSRRQGDSLLVDWTCVALDHPRNHTAIVRARLRLAAVTVWSETSRVQLSGARAELVRRFPDFGFSKPERASQGYRFRTTHQGRAQRRPSGRCSG
jgi:hypothetical protein